MYLIFGIRLKNIAKTCKPTPMSNALNRLTDNYLNDRSYWEAHLTQNSTLYTFLQILHNHLS